MLVGAAAAARLAWSVLDHFGHKIDQNLIKKLISFAWSVLGAKKVCQDFLKTTPLRINFKEILISELIEHTFFQKPRPSILAFQQC